MKASLRSSTGDTLPRHELQAPGAMGNVRLAVCDLLGFRAGRGAEDDHAGAESVAGVVEERPGADQHALRLELMDELVVELGELLRREIEPGPWLDHLVVDDPALLTVAHDAFLQDPIIGRQDRASQAGSKATCACADGSRRHKTRVTQMDAQRLMPRQMCQEPNMKVSMVRSSVKRARSSHGLIIGLPSIVRFISHRLNGRTSLPPRPGGNLAS